MFPIVLQVGAPGLDHEFVVKQSPEKLLLCFFGSLAFVLTGLIMLHSTGINVQVGGMATVLFFGIAAGLFAWRVTRTEHVILTLSERGLTDYRMFDAPVPWSQILGARSFRMYGSRFIELQLRNPELYPCRGLARLHAMTGWSPHILYLGFLDRPGDEVALAFEGYYEEYIQRSGLALAVRPARLGAGILLQARPP